MADTPDIGLGTTVEVETDAGSGSYTALGLVTNLTPPNQSVDDIDVTTMDSANRTREFIQGLIDPGDMSVDLLYDPGGDTDDFILTWREQAENRSVRITYPGGAKDTFSAYPKSYAPSIPVGDKMSATLTLKVAGAITRS